MGTKCLETEKSCSKTRNKLAGTESNIPKQVILTTVTHEFETFSLEKGDRKLNVLLDEVHKINGFSQNTKRV